MAIPSGYSSLGLIGFTDKGDYNADTNYVQNDLCHNGGKIWKCKLDNTSGQTPAEGTYWTVFVDPTSSVSEMEDVTLTSLADGQELTYDATANKWKNTSEISNLKQALSNEVEARAKLGAHNRLPLDLANIKALNTTGTWSGDTYTVNGVSFQINSDLSITVSGTSSSSASLSLYTNLNANIKGCILSGNPSNYATLAVQNMNSPWNTIASVKNGSEATITDYGNLSVYAYILVAANTTIPEAFTVSPLIRDAKDASKIFTPYAMTNRELTARQIGYVDVDIANTSLSNETGGKYYTTVIPTLPNNSHVVSVTWGGQGGWQANVSFMINGKTNAIILLADTSITIASSNRVIRVYYYVEN